MPVGNPKDASPNDVFGDMNELGSDGFINEAAMKASPTSETIVTERKSPAIDVNIRKALTDEMEQLKQENSRLQDNVELEKLRMQRLLESEANREQDWSRLIGQIERMEFRIDGKIARASQQEIGYAK